MKELLEGSATDGDGLLFQLGQLSLGEINEFLRLIAYLYHQQIAKMCSQFLTETPQIVPVKVKPLNDLQATNPVAVENRGSSV